MEQLWAGCRCAHENPAPVGTYLSGKRHIDLCLNRLRIQSSSLLQSSTGRMPNNSGGVSQSSQRANA
ncbi:MAG TPA: hypothetical protein DIW77_00420 [Chromatiaceae bacterium]|nr:hypothetical protein [Chromatiaceae bacterium]